LLGNILAFLARSLLRNLLAFLLWNINALFARNLSIDNKMHEI
jgi:hypothetical protein